MASNTATRTLIDRALIVLAVGAVAAALCAAAPSLVGDAQAAMPAADWRLPVGPRAFRAACPEPCVRRVLGTVNAPTGQGWG